MSSLFEARNSYENCLDSKITPRTSQVKKPQDRVRIRKDYAFAKVGRNPENGIGKAPELGSLLSGEVVQVRTEYLVENYPNLARDYLKNPDINRLAEKYVPWDYKISPDLAKTIIQNALEQLLTPEELANPQKPRKKSRTKKSKSLISV